jgi:hypothetical protein
MRALRGVIPAYEHTQTQPAANAPTYHSISPIFLNLAGVKPAKCLT